jgi:hypothetical protein
MSEPEAIVLACGKCGKTGVRLYRPGGEFRRPERDRCNAHVTTEQQGWYVPVVTDRSGEVWGYTSCPPEHLEAFLALPEADPQAPSWTPQKGWPEKGGW